LSAEVNGPFKRKKRSSFLESQVKCSTSSYMLVVTTKERG
jgi:hypothetical protein